MLRFKVFDTVKKRWFWRDFSSENGGSQPIGAVFQFAPTDVAAQSDYDLAPDQIVDNLYDFNEIPLPAGIGFTVTADGAHPIFTTTEAGTWAFYAGPAVTADAT